MMRREKVHIPKTKRYIFMRGNGKGKTAIVWSQSSSDNIASATFKVEAPDFIAFGISFKVCNDLVSPYSSYIYYDSKIFPF